MGQLISRSTPNPTTLPQPTIESRISTILIPTFHTTPTDITSRALIDLQLMYTSQEEQGLFTFLVAPWSQQLLPGITNRDAINKFGNYLKFTKEKEILDIVSTYGPPGLSSKPICTMYQFHEDGTGALSQNSTTNNININNNNVNSHNTKFITMITGINPKSITNVNGGLDGVRNRNEYTYTTLEKVTPAPQPYNHYAPKNVAPVNVDVDNRPKLHSNKMLNIKDDVDQYIQKISPIYVQHDSSQFQHTTETQDINQNGYNNLNNTKHDNKNVFRILLTNQNQFMSKVMTFHHECHQPDENPIYQHIPFSFIILDLTNNEIGDEKFYSQFKSDIKHKPNINSDKLIPLSIYGDLLPIIQYCYQISQLTSMGCIYPHTRPVYIVKIGFELLDRHQYDDWMVDDIFQSFGLAPDFVFHELPQGSTYSDIANLFHTILQHELVKIIQTQTPMQLLPLVTTSTHKPTSIQLKKEYNLASYCVPPLGSFQSLNNYIFTPHCLYDFNQYHISKFKTKHEIWNGVGGNPRQLALLYDTIKNRHKTFVQPQQQLKLLLKEKPTIQSLLSHKLIITPSYTPRFYFPYQFLPPYEFKTTTISFPQQLGSQGPFTNDLLSSRYYWLPSELIFISTTQSLPRFIQDSFNNLVKPPPLPPQMMKNNNTNNHDSTNTFQPTFSQSAPQSVPITTSPLYQYPIPSNINLPRVLSFPIKMYFHLPSHEQSFKPSCIGFQMTLSELFSKKCINYIYPQYFNQDKINLIQSQQIQIPDQQPHEPQQIQDQQEYQQPQELQSIQQVMTDNITTDTNTNHNVNSQSLPSPDSISILINNPIRAPRHYDTNSAIIATPFSTLFQCKTIELEPTPLNTHDLDLCLSLSPFPKLFQFEQLEDKFGQCLFDPNYCTTIPKTAPILNQKNQIVGQKSIDINDSLYNAYRNVIEHYFLPASLSPWVSLTSFSTIPFHIMIFVPLDWDVDCNQLNQYNETTIKTILNQPRTIIPSDLISTDNNDNNSNNNGNQPNDTFCSRTRELNQGNKMNLCRRFQTMLLKQFLLLHTIAFGPFQHHACHNTHIQGGAMGLCNVITHPHLYYRIHFVKSNENDIQQLFQQLQRDAILKRMKLIEESWGISQ